MQAWKVAFLLACEVQGDPLTTVAYHELSPSGEEGGNRFVTGASSTKMISPCTLLSAATRRQDNSDRLTTQKRDNRK